MPKAKSGIMNFLHVIDVLQERIPYLRPSQVLDLIVKTIKYKEYLIKEE
jgi:hypothetical protein